MFPLSIFLFSWTAWSLLSFNFCSQSFCPNGGLSWARCSTRRSVSSSGKVSLFVPSSVGSQSVHQPRHQHTHTHARARVSTSPPLTGRCHLRRQLQSLVWLLSSNQRPSSLSTATWPWGYHCHTVYTRLQLTPPPPKTHIIHRFVNLGEEKAGGIEWCDCVLSGELISRVMETGRRKGKGKKEWRREDKVGVRDVCFS